MAQDIKRTLGLRKQIKSRKPVFVKQDIHKKPKLSPAYRKPRGHQSKMRLQKKGYRKTPTSGYGSPKAARNLSSNGLLPFLVNNTAELERIDKEKECIIISSKTGLKKKSEIVKKALEMNIIIDNIKDGKKFLDSVKERLKQKKDAKKKKASERKSKKKSKESEKKNKEESVEQKLDDDEKKEETKKEQDKKEKDKILEKKR